MEPYNAVRLIVGVSLLFVATAMDMHHREVENTLWGYIGLSGLILWYLQGLGWIAGLSLAITAVLALVIYRLGSGAADAKALITLAVLTPLWPNAGGSGQMVPFPLMVLFVAMIGMAAVSVVWLTVVNVIRGNVRLPHMLVALKMSVREARRQFVWPLHGAWLGERCHQRFDGLPLGKQVWVSPRIPFMPFLLIGFVVCFVAGSPTKFFGLLGVIP